jgi:predicted SprT family Zn-dependent metalloprotease
MNDYVAKEICEENSIGSWFLASVPIRFEDLKVTAKTVNGSIVLDPKLMKKPFKILMRYVIHELVHAIQHIEEYGKKQTDKRKDYLNREDEIEAFQYQVKYDEDQRGEAKVEEYVDGLLKYHDVPEDQRKDKKKEIMERADED